MMTSKERVESVMAGEIPDFVPVEPGVTLEPNFVMKYIGEDVDQYFRNSKKCFMAIKKIYKDFNFDMILAGFSALIYPELFGGKVCYKKNKMPHVEKPVFKGIEEVEKAEIKSPDEVPVFKSVLESLKMLVDDIGNEVAVSGCTSGTFSVASQLVGVERFLKSLRTDLEFVSKITKIAGEAIVEVGKKIIDVGVKYIYYPDAISSGSILSPSQYEQVAKPLHSMFFKKMKEAGDVYTIYHPCGSEYPLLCEIKNINNVDVFHFSENVDFSVLRKIFGPTKVLMGGVDIKRTLCLGNSAEIETEVRKVITGAGKHGRLILAPGCSGEIPINNLRSFIEISRKLGKYPVVV